MTVASLASGTVTLDGTGAGTIQLGPKVYGVVWHVSRMIVATANGSNVEARIYRNFITTANLTDSSRRSNAASETDITLQANDSLVAGFSGGTPGVIASFALEGEQVR